MILLEVVDFRYRNPRVTSSPEIVNSYINTTINMVHDIHMGAIYIRVSDTCQHSINLFHSRNLHCNTKFRLGHKSDQHRNYKNCRSTPKELKKCQISNCYFILHSLTAKALSCSLDNCSGRKTKFCNGCVFSCDICFIIVLMEPVSIL